MKRFELLEMAEGLDRVRQKGSKFCYAITKNKRKLQQEVRDMEQAIKPSEKFKEFLQETETLKRKLAKKDDKGNPIIVQKLSHNGNYAQHYDIPDAETPGGEFQEKMKVITTKYKEYIKEHEAKVKDYREGFLQEDVEFQFHMIKLEDIPEDISQEEMDIIFPMISNGEEGKNE